MPGAKYRPLSECVHSGTLSLVLVVESRRNDSRGGALGCGWQTSLFAEMNKTFSGWGAVLLQIGIVFGNELSAELVQPALAIHINRNHQCFSWKNRIHHRAEMRWRLVCVDASFTKGVIVSGPKHSIFKREVKVGCTPIMNLKGIAGRVYTNGTAYEVKLGS